MLQFANNVSAPVRNRTWYNYSTLFITFRVIKDQNCKRKCRGQQIIKPKKMYTKSDQRNWKQLKNFNKYRNKSKINESYYCYQENPKIIWQISKKKKNNDQSWTWTSPRWRETSPRLFTTEWSSEQWLLSIQRTYLDNHRQIHCQTLILQEKTSSSRRKNSSGCPDEFPAKLLKQCSKSLAHPLQLQYKASLQRGEIQIDRIVDF